MPLVIDPVLAYSTYLGGAGEDLGTAVAVDAGGAAVVTGLTGSADLPTTVGAFDTTYNSGTDVFVAKLDPAGTSLLYATYLGGTGRDTGNDVALDANGAAYVTGTTGSADFPATVGAFDTTYGGLDDAFVAKLDPAGAALGYSTYLGGTGFDTADGVAVDGSGAAYVTGTTASPEFPVTVGAFDATIGPFDAFVTKVNADGSALGYSTALGGSSHDEGDQIAVDGSGAAYVTGLTASATSRRPPERSTRATTAKTTST